MSRADPLLQARALVLNDLAAQGLADAHTVSLVEESVSQRRWWVSQWQGGVAYVDGLVAQDVQDALFDESCRWPVCAACGDPMEHSLSIQPELGPDPHWVCSESGALIAPLGTLPGG
ncbi:MAG: FIG01121840: hypothetical protein [uncultured Nocardioidaceae bacterium]|uniref:Uncharacterized protein n=1 Tax=uncultured Nocardioidaceae bacterium TaxID=253824 RepID=A0A6J4NBW0_9ACTN|nr:MAG: FIG01121840: hypothetical protein [uncultured Nocardioidaceae bacterium]